jgi:DNA-binding CsgD family transcriptional regulator
MSDSIDLDLLEQIYDIPLGKCAWDQVMLELRRLFVAEVGILIEYGRSGGDVRELSLSGVDESAWREYGDYYAAIDPFFEAIQSGRMRSGVVTSDTQVMPRKSFERSEYYNDFWRPRGLGYSAGAFTRFGDGRSVLIGLPRFRDVGEYDDAELARLQLCFNHIARALRLQQTLERHPDPPDLDALARRFMLTPAEVGLVAMLIEEGCLRRAAERLQRKHNTVRAQLRSIFSKTGTNSQVALMTRIHDR